MTINYPSGDADARGQTARPAGSNIDDTDGVVPCGVGQMALRPE